MEGEIGRERESDDGINLKGRQRVESPGNMRRFRFFSTGPSGGQPWAGSVIGPGPGLDQLEKKIRAYCKSCSALQNLLLQFENWPGSFFPGLEYNLG